MMKTTVFLGFILGIQTKKVVFARSEKIRKNKEWKFFFHRDQNERRGNPGRGKSKKRRKKNASLLFLVVIFCFLDCRVVPPLFSLEYMDIEEEVEKRGKGGTSRKDKIFIQKRQLQELSFSLYSSLWRSLPKGTPPYSEQPSETFFSKK